MCTPMYNSSPLASYFPPQQAMRTSMKYGFVLSFVDARDAAELAYLAEAAGWDGFFVWAPVWGVDAWVSLTAAAMRTERIRLGTMVTLPLADAAVGTGEQGRHARQPFRRPRGDLRRHGRGRHRLCRVWRGDRPQDARRTARRRAGNHDRALAQAALPLRRQALPDPADNLQAAAPAGAAAAHFYLGGRRLAVAQVHGTGAPV